MVTYRHIWKLLNLFEVISFITFKGAGSCTFSKYISSIDIIKTSIDCDFGFQTCTNALGEIGLWSK
jgi:hypothetical protein